MPTVFDIDSDKWGYQVAPDMKPIKWFKLLLLSDNDLAREENQEISQSKQLQDARTHLSKYRKITAVDLVGRYLKKLWDHTYAMLKTMMKIDDIPIHVAITAPANWSHNARKALRQAVKQAGITTKGPNGALILKLVREPEAPAKSIMREHGLVVEIKVILFTPINFFFSDSKHSLSLVILSLSVMPGAAPWYDIAASIFALCCLLLIMHRTLLATRWIRMNLLY